MSAIVDVFLYVVVGLGVVAAVGILLHPDPVEPRISRRQLRQLNQRLDDEEGR
jgi:hypothetical protein